MKKLNLIKVLGVFFVFHSFNISFADPVWTKESRAMSSLVGNVDQQHVNAFKGEIKAIIESLRRELGGKGCSGDGKIQLRIAYLKDLIGIVKNILQYQGNPNQQLQNDLEAIAKTYGGKVRELIWSIIYPARVLPPPPHPLAPAAPLPPPSVEDNGGFCCNVA